MSKSLTGIYTISANTFSDKAGTTITNGEVTANKLISKGDIQVNGNIVNGNQSIVFDPVYNFINIAENFHVFKLLFLDYNGTTYNVGQYIASGSSGSGSGYPSINYDSATSTTSFIGNLSFPSQSIASNAIINNDFMTLDTSQNVSSSKTFSTQQNFSNSIRLDSSLLLNSGNLTLNNSNLQKIQWLSNVSSDIAASLSTLSTKLTDISYSSVSPITTTINNKLQCSTISFSNTLNGVSTVTYGYISTLSSNCQNQLTSNANSITSAQNDIQVLKDATRNLTATSSASTFANILNTSTLNSSTFVFSNTINSFSATDFSNVMFYCKNLTSDASASILALQNKTQNLSYSANTSSFSNTLNSSTFAFSNTINGFSVLDFSNVMFYCKTLTSSAQDQITAATATAASALALATTASAGVAGIVTVSIPGLQGQITAQGVLIGNNSDAIGTLQQKCTGLSYSNATTKSSFNILDVTTFRMTTLESGFTQVGNNPIIIVGTCDHRNTLSISNGFGISCDGGIVQNNNSANTFNGSVSCIRDFTSSGTNINLNSSNIQIGTSTAAALTINATSTVNSDMTFSATKKLVIKNIVPRNLEDIYFGAEAGAYQNYNVNFNMKVVLNEDLNTFSDVTLGSNAFRYPFNSYNDSFTVNANTSISLTAPIVSIGQTLGVTTVYGSLVCGNIYTPGGVISALGQAIQQF